MKKFLIKVKLLLKKFFKNICQFIKTYKFDIVVVGWLFTFLVYNNCLVPNYSTASASSNAPTVGETDIYYMDVKPRIETSVSLRWTENISLDFGIVYDYYETIDRTLSVETPSGGNARYFAVSWKGSDVNSSVPLISTSPMYDYVYADIYDFEFILSSTGVNGIFDGLYTPIDYDDWKETYFEWNYYGFGSVVSYRMDDVNSNTVHIVYQIPSYVNVQLNEKPYGSFKISLYEDVNKDVPIYIEDLSIFSVAYEPLWRATDLDRLIYDHAVYIYKDKFYDEGYYEGKQVGLSVTLDKVTPLEVIKSSVNSLLNLELFPNVKLSYLLYIGLGLGILTLILKVI